MYFYITIAPVHRKGFSNEGGGIITEVMIVKGPGNVYNFERNPSCYFDTRQPALKERRPVIGLVKGKSYFPFVQMKAQNKIDRIINIVFSFIMLAALVIGLACALRGKIEVNEYENRYAEKFKAFTIAAYLNSDFQDNVETALADQLPFAIDTKQRYNSLLASYSDRVLKLAGGASTYDLAEDETSSAEEEARLAAEMAAAEGERLEALKQRKAEQARGIRKDVELDPNFKYIRSASGMAVAVDHLLYPCRFLAGEQSKLDRRIENINHVIETYPGPEYYIYYVEKETDVDFETGERSGIYEYLSEGVDLPSEHKACYMLDRFSQLHSYYYHSDTHSVYYRF